MAENSEPVVTSEASPEGEAVRKPKATMAAQIRNDAELDWFRRKGETRKSFEAFCIFRDMGRTRSLSRVATTLGKSKSLIARWSARNDWVRRAEDFDAQEDYEAMVRAQEARLTLRERDGEIARVVKDKVMKRLQSIKPEELTPKETIEWFKVASNIERLAYGEATAISESRKRPGAGEGALEELFEAIQENPDLMDAYADLIAKETRGDN